MKAKEFYNAAIYLRLSRDDEDIEAGNVDCVIVKDLSRLGRDYIEAGRLIQKTFPAFSVRFIALTDHFDSLTADYNETLVSFVKHILVYEDKRVYLELGYKELFSKVIMFADYVESSQQLRGEAV